MCNRCLVLIIACSLRPGAVAYAFLRVLFIAPVTPLLQCDPNPIAVTKRTAKSFIFTGTSWVLVGDTGLICSSTCAEAADFLVGRPFRTWATEVLTCIVSCGRYRREEKPAYRSDKMDRSLEACKLVLYHCLRRDALLWVHHPTYLDCNSRAFFPWQNWNPYM